MEQSAPPGPPEAMSEIALQTRRVMLPALALGIVGLVLATVLGQPLAGVGVCLGLGLGMVNARLLQDAVRRRFEALTDAPGRRTGFLSSGASRLAGLTVLTILLVILVRPLGFGMLIGLAVFQVTMIGIAAAAMYRQVRA
jgi:hypothetical protein